MDDPSQPAPHPGSPPWHPKQQYRPPGLGEASPRAAPASKAEPGPLEVLRGWAIPAGLGGAQAPSSGHGASLAATTDPAESDDGRSSAYDAPPAPDVDAAQRAAAAEQALAQLHQQMEQQQALLQDASYRAAAAEQRQGQLEALALQLSREQAALAEELEAARQKDAAAANAQVQMGQLAQHLAGAVHQMQVLQGQVEGLEEEKGRLQVATLQLERERRAWQQRCGEAEEAAARAAPPLQWDAQLAEARREQARLGALVEAQRRQLEAQAGQLHALQRERLEGQRTQALLSQQLEEACWQLDQLTFGGGEAEEEEEEGEGEAWPPEPPPLPPPPPLPLPLRVPPPAETSPTFLRSAAQPYPPPPAAEGVGAPSKAPAAEERRWGEQVDEATEGAALQRQPVAPPAAPSTLQGSPSGSAASGSPTAATSPTAGGRPQAALRPAAQPFVPRALQA